MLWISSWISTVLPTPAPPKRPILPPRTYGAIRSITLMPVSKISTFEERSLKSGGSRWIGQRSLPAGGDSLPSTGSPSTFQTRPSVTSPTGTEIGAPVSTTAVPRAMPSVASMATARTRSSPRCCCTSANQTAAVGPRDSQGGVDLGQPVRKDSIDDNALDLDQLADVLIAIGGHGSPRSRWCLLDLPCRGRRGAREPAESIGGRAGGTGQATTPAQLRRSPARRARASDRNGPAHAGSGRRGRLEATPAERGTVARPATIAAVARAAIAIRLAARGRA